MICCIGNNMPSIVRQRLAISSLHNFSNTKYSLVLAIVLAFPNSTAF